MTTERVEPAEQQWRARPVLAATLRLVLLAVPLVASTGATFAVSRMLPPGAGSTWWGLTALLAIAVAVAVAVERAARRLLPIALLLKLSMIFPDRAPSRLKLARSAAVRTPSTEIVWSGDDDKPTSTADLVLNLVSALGSHDRRTRGHSERVRLLCDMLAEELKLDVDARDRLRWSALLHDVGKMKVATSILNKPGRLDAREFDRIKQHPAAGAELAAPLLPWLGEWGDGILDHHEKYDGSGYPNGKSGPDISQAGRIIGLIDAFETMTAARPYKKAMATKVAREELARCAGTHFDPVFVRAFLAISLPRVLWTMGPLSFLFQLPFIRPLAEAGVRSGVAAPQAAAAALVSGATGAAVLVSGGLGSPSTPALTGLADQAAPGVPQSAPQWLHDQLGSERVSDEVVAVASTTTLEPADEQQQARQEAAAAGVSPRAVSEPSGEAPPPEPVQQPRSEPQGTQAPAQEQPPAAAPTDEPPTDEPVIDEPVIDEPPAEEPPAEEPAVHEPLPEQPPVAQQPATQEPAPSPAPTLDAPAPPVVEQPAPVFEPAPAQTRAEEDWADDQPPPPAPEPTASPSPEPDSVAPEPSATATPSPALEPEPSPSASEEVVVEPTATTSPTSEPAATATPTPEPEPVLAASPTAPASPAATADPEPTLATATPSASPATDPEPTASAAPSPSGEPVASATPSPSGEPEQSASPSPEATATATASPSPEPTVNPSPTTEPESTQVTVAGTGPAIASGPASPSTSRTATFTLHAIEGVQWECQVLGNGDGGTSAWVDCPSGEYTVSVVKDGKMTFNVRSGQLKDSWTWTVQTVTVSPRSLSDVLLLDDVVQPDGPADRSDGLGLMALLMGVAVPVAAAARRVRSRSS